MPRRTDGHVVSRLRALFLFLVAALLLELAPPPSAHANGLWTVDNFATESLKITGSRYVSRATDNTGELPAGQRWALYSSGPAPWITLSSQSLGSVRIALNDARGACRYYGAAGIEVAPASAGLHCLLDDSGRIRITRNSAATTIVRQIGPSLTSVEGDWVVPRVTLGDCSAAGTASNPMPWLKIRVGMQAGAKSYLLGTSVACVHGQAEHVLWHSVGKQYGAVVDLPLRAGERVRATIRYLGGESERYKLTARIVDPATGVQISRSLIAEDGPLGETRTRLAGAQPENVCWTTCATSTASVGSGRSTPPTSAAWAMTADPDGPLTFAGEMPVKVRINDAPPLVSRKEPPPLRTDVLTATHSADGGRFVYPIVGSADVLTDPGEWPYSTLTIDGGFAHN